MPGCDRHVNVAINTFVDPTTYRYDFKIGALSFNIVWRKFNLLCNLVVCFFLYFLVLKNENNKRKSYTRFVLCVFPVNLWLVLECNHLGGIPLLYQQLIAGGFIHQALNSMSKGAKRCLVKNLGKCLRRKDRKT